MSELIITIKDLLDIERYKKADSFLVGNSSFCVRYNHSFSLLEIKELRKITKKSNKNLYVNVNKIFQETELESLENYLKYLKEIDVDAIFFSDFAVLRLAKKLNVDNRCILYHETYPTNTFDLEVLLSFNLKGVIMSKEVEIDALRNATRFNNSGMTAFGHLEIFNSKRTLVEYYIKKHNLNYDLVNNYSLSIKEMTRDNLYPLFQDQNGTNIFTSFVYSSLKDFKELKDLKMKYFIIDTIFLDDEYCQKVLNIFDDLRSDKAVDLDKFYQESKYPLDSGFLHLDVSLTKKENKLNGGNNYE